MTEATPFVPITDVTPSEKHCFLRVDPAIMADPERLERLKLMLAALFHGSRVMGNAEVSGIKGDLVIDGDRYIGSLATLTLSRVNSQLAALAVNPVRLLTRGTKPMQWLLILSFQASAQHFEALRRIPEIDNAITSPDLLYGGKMVELFVPEDQPSYDIVTPLEEDDAAPDDDWLGVSETELRKRIEEVLSFDLGVKAD
ncbi:MAG TPA: hypothetical protein VJM32_02835 [Candidatus Saccharimonadales bacterium]|nr:hypothetical protein [Candidatus Saccharimonadales bacterium]